MPNCDADDADCNVVDQVDSIFSTAVQPPTTYYHDDDEAVADEQADQVQCRMPD